jgi:hypothetical protein
MEKSVIKGLLDNLNDSVNINNKQARIDEVLNNSPKFSFIKALLKYLKVIEPMQLAEILFKY